MEALLARIQRSTASASRPGPARPRGVPWRGAGDAIAVDGLHVYYGRHHALKGVSLRVGARKVTALIGPSGCGKSTFLRSLNRMNDLAQARVEGRVVVLGQDVYAPQTDVVELRSRVGMVFQTPNPFPKSIFENVVYGLRRQGIRNRRQLEEAAEESLVQAALWDEVKDRLHGPALSLSGGQQQRLCIARCLAVRPDVLLMDEPTSALDPGSTAKIEELIHGLKASYTVVVATHNMHQAARVSDETAFFLQGELVEAGPTGALFTRPLDPRTEGYITGRFG